MLGYEEIFGQRVLQSRDDGQEKKKENKTKEKRNSCCYCVSYWKCCIVGCVTIMSLDFVSPLRALLDRSFASRARRKTAIITRGMSRCFGERSQGKSNRAYNKSIKFISYTNGEELIIMDYIYMWAACLRVRKMTYVCAYTFTRHIRHVFIQIPHTLNRNATILCIVFCQTH